MGDASRDGLPEAVIDMHHVEVVGGLAVGYSDVAERVEGDQGMAEAVAAHIVDLQLVALVLHEDFLEVEEAEHGGVVDADE